MTVAELLATAAGDLPVRPGLPDPRREARYLLARLLARPESWITAHGEAAVADHQVERFRAWVARRARGEPAHLIVGRCPFWGRELLVTRDVLLPRPETELLVEHALALPLPARPRVLDLGTGSGCLAVTFALELSDARVVAVDRSHAAAAVARRNAALHGAGVTVLVADLAAPLAARFDLVAANLPYIPSAAIGGLPIEVRAWEPRGALDGGADGMECLRRAVDRLPELLTPGGVALLEVGPGQAATLASRARDAGCTEIDRLVDLGGVERVLVLTAAG